MGLLVLQGTQQSCNRGGSAQLSRVQPFILLYTIFDRKGVYITLTKEPPPAPAPLYIPSLDCCMPLNYCKCIVFQI